MTTNEAALHKALLALYRVTELNDETQAAYEAAEAVLAGVSREPCIGRDPLCPCQDGDSCHYVDTEDTKAWPIPMPPIEVGDSIVHGRPKEPVQFMYRVSEYERQGWQDDPNVIAVLRPIWTRTETPS